MNSIFIIAIILLILAIAILSLFFLSQRGDLKSLKIKNGGYESNISSLNNQLTHIVGERDRYLSIMSLERDQERVESTNRLNDKEDIIRNLIRDKVSAETLLVGLEDKLLTQKQEQQRLNEQSRSEFKNLATDILNEQTAHFKQTNKESLDILLKPFKDNISEFRERVEKIYSDGNQQQGALRNELKTLIELNNRITTETKNLTQALKGNSKIQGDWGEMILETILDNSNLIKGIHYDTQVNIKDAQGNNLRPDVVLYLPEKKRIIID